jgi:glucose-6-phosphate 1-dehydrogenase
MAHQSFQPGATGMQTCCPPDPCLVVLCGASGDLTHRELIPSLYELAQRGLLPDPVAIVGFARNAWSDDEFRSRMREAVQRECRFDADTWDRFARSLFYVPGDFTSPADADYASLRQRIGELQGSLGLPDHVLVHLATPPSFFGTIVERLHEAGIAHSDGGWRRIVIEKPFGVDEASANELDRTVLRVFEESQVYRIDHFLGKETVQNMLVVRFANPSFEPIWNRNFIDHVQITVAEDIGIGTRAAFYEKTGVVRDMVQNHLLQLLCMVAIEPPTHFDGTALRNETAKVLEAVAPLNPARDCVRGQYGPGTTDGKALAGYRQEDNVADDSLTPTFAAVKLTIDNWRWAGVPFYLRTGKRMAQKLTEVAVHFRPTPHLMFPVEGGVRSPSRMVFRLQPEEGILQTFIAKQPGPHLAIQPVTMSFRYATAFGVEELPRAYAWLLLDVMEGDQTLFARRDWIARAWEIVDPLVRHWDESPPPAFPNYAAGSWGPDAADELLARDGRAWQAI